MMQSHHPVIVSLCRDTLTDLLDQFINICMNACCCFGVD